MIPQGHQVGDVTHERTDVDGIGLFLIVALLFLLLAICFAGVGGLVHFLNAQQKQPHPLRRSIEQVKSFPAPRLQAVPGVDWVEDQAAQQHQLNSYSWVDRSQGIARIPIERAMQLLVDRGLPEVGAGQTPLQLMQARPKTNAQPPRANSTPTP